MSEIHLIGNAHLDAAWLWKWQEGCSEVLATFRSALDRMKEFDDFIFTCAGVRYYQWVEKMDPEMFSEIRQRVAEGRWIIVGGWMIQPDCNAPCGESFARHSLYGQTWLREKFGRIAKTGYNVDSFGHNGMLPQILRKSGMTSYVYMRPGEGKEKNYPFSSLAFRWISADGSAVKAFRIPDAYNSVPGDGLTDKLTNYAARSRETCQPAMCFYGVGNHGGGPTIENILAILRLQSEDCENHYVFSSPDHFFDELPDKDLPEYYGDILHHASGCYSAVSAVKAMNRIGESRLLNAERAGSMASLLGVRKNTSLKEAWQPVLFNHFHDIMGGCCIRSAIQDALNGFCAGIHAADEVENEALQMIAWNIDTSSEKPVILNKKDFRVWEKDNKGTPVIVFNPHAFPVCAPVRLHAAFRSVENADHESVVQQLARAEHTNFNDKYESEIIASIPAMGWQLFWGYLTKENPDISSPEMQEGASILENDSFRVSFSPDGYIEQIEDKIRHRMLLSGCVKPLVIEDIDNDTWAHNVFTFDRCVGVFENGKIVFSRCGPVSQQIRITYTYGASTLTMDIILYQNLKDIRIHCLLNWQEKHKILKLAFPIALENGRDIASVPYGFIEREADGKEQPMQKWVCVRDKESGLGFATDVKTAYSFQNNELRITCARSALFADHYGCRDDYCEYIDQGEQKFSFLLYPSDHFCPLEQAGELMLAPLSSILGTYHTGTIPSSGSLLSIDRDNILVTAFKAAEDGNGYILHCHECDGKDTQAELTVPGLNIRFSANFRPQEIKCFRLCENSVIETDFLEESII